MPRPYLTTQLPKIVVLPPRSHLFSLTPIGIGTPGVESMTSYVMRLAEAHVVSPKTLVTREILPLFQREFLLDSRHEFLPVFWSNNIPALNSTQSWALDWVKVVEDLTSQPHLRFLTMLPWAQVIASKTLIRRTRAWCPLCYNEWRSQGQLLYEPLLWNLACITVCPKHYCIFDTRCPTCQSAQPLLGPQSRPGYCVSCQGWLGRDVVQPGTGDYLSEDDLQDQLWKANVVGELLAVGPSIEVPLERKIIAERLTVYLAPLIKDGKYQLRHVSPLSRETLRDLREGRAVPQLKTLLKVSSWLDLSPLQLLLEDPDLTRIEHIGRRLSKVSGRPSSKRRGPSELEELRIELERYLADSVEPPLSLSALARRLQCHTPFLHKRFPEQSRAITTRFSTYMKSQAMQKQQVLEQEVYSIVQAIHAEGVYPSTSRVAERMRHPKSIRAPEAKAAYCKAFHDLNIE